MADLPKQVQEQADLAEAQAKQLSGVHDDAQTAEGNTSEQGSWTNDAGNTQQDSTDYEQKYRTLQGMFNAEMNRLKGALAEKDNRISELQNEISESETANEEPVEFGTEDDRANFGSDFVDLVERGVAARTSQYQDEIKQLKAQVAQMGSQLNQAGQNAEVGRRAVFLNELDQMYPEWRQLNSDKGFLAWLKEPDPVSGIVRNDLLQKYNSDMNSYQVINIFRAYGGNPSYQQRTPNLARQVSPSRGRPTQAPNGKPVYTEAQIKDFYDGVRRHYYTDEQADAIEKDIELAYAEGRIVQ